MIIANKFDYIQRDDIISDNANEFSIQINLERSINLHKLNIF